MNNTGIFATKEETEELKKLAEKYNITRGNIYHVLKNRIWNKIDGQI